LFLNRGAIHLWNDGLLDSNGNIVRDTGFPDIPTFPEAYAAAYGQPPTGMLMDVYRAIIPLIGNAGKTILVSSQVPEEAKQALRAAVVAMANDANYSARVIEENRGYGLLYGQELDNAITMAASLNEEQISFLRTFISGQYEIEFEP
jgi:hypothetical protein